MIAYAEVSAEILDGSIMTLREPAPRHSYAQGSLHHFVGGPFHFQAESAGGVGGWWVLMEVDIRLDPRNLVQPDLAGWRRTRLPFPWDERPVDLVPDWIAEVVSESNVTNDVIYKRRLYAAHGVASYWILDPRYRTLEALVLNPDTHAWVEAGVYGDGDVVRIPPFEAIELDVGRLFPPASAAPT